MEHGTIIYLVDIVITFSRAPTPLIVVDDIACVFWLFKSRTHFCCSNRVRILVIHIAYTFLLIKSRARFWTVKIVNCHCPRATSLRGF